jgi:hypothetical protein
MIAHIIKLVKSDKISTPNDFREYEHGVPDMLPGMESKRIYDILFPINLNHWIKRRKIYYIDISNQNSTIQLRKIVLFV